MGPLEPERSPIAPSLPLSLSLSRGWEKREAETRGASNPRGREENSRGGHLRGNNLRDASDSR